MHRSDATVPTKMHNEPMMPKHRLRNAFLALIGWLVPPALGQMLYRSDVDALGWMNVQAVFREHPGFYGFWCGVLYIQIIVLLVRTARHGRRVPAMLFVLFGGFVNLLVAKEPTDSRIQLEPWGAQLLLSPLSSYGNTVMAPRLVCLWLALEEIGDERALWRLARLALGFHPVLLSLLCGWITTPVLYASLVLGKAVSIANRITTDKKDEITQAREVDFASVFAATASGALHTIGIEPGLSDGSDDGELMSISLRDTQEAYGTGETAKATIAATRELSVVELDGSDQDDVPEPVSLSSVRGTRGKPRGARRGRGARGGHANVDKAAEGNNLP